MKTTAKVLSVVLALVLLVCAFTLVISATDTVVESGTVYNETWKTGETVTGKTWTGANCIHDAFYQSTHNKYGPSNYAELQKIKLMSDAVVDGDFIYVRRNVVFDLNGYTLTFTGNPQDVRGTFYCDTAGSNFTITGEGKIITSGNRPFFSEAVNESAGLYTLNIIGTGKGIDIEFDATTNGSFVSMNGGNVNFENVDIVYKGHSTTSPAFTLSGNYNPTVSFKNSTFEALENSIKIGLGDLSNSVNQGDKACFNLNANGSVKFDGSSVRISNNGAMFNLNGGTVGNSETGVVVDAKNSYFDAAGRFNAGSTIFGVWKQQYQGIYNFDNCEICYAQRFDASNWNSTTNPPVFNIKDTKITKLAGWFNQTKDFSSYDAANYPGRTYNVTGNSAIITDFDILTGTAHYSHNGIGSWVKLGEGVRVASPEGVKNATFAEGCQLYFDPAGDPTAPWIVAKEAPATADAAKDVYYANMSLNFYGEGSNFTHRTANSDGSTVTVADTAAPAANPAHNGESSIKHGTVSSAKIGANSVYKYTVLAPDNDEDATVFPSGDQTDAYTITGKAFNLKTYPQVVVDADIMANENGFANLIIAFQVRGQSGAARAGGTDAGIRVYNNGTISYSGSAGNLLKTAENMPKLSVTDWNHITIVCDAVKNTATFYVNGVFAVEGKLINNHDGYMAGTEDGLYCQGFRVSTTTGGHKVGSGYIIDNVMQRGYENSGAAYTQLYTAAEVVANENIRVNGQPYQTVDQAIKAANDLNSTVQLYGDVKSTQTVTTNGTVNLNGYDFNYSAESYPVVRATATYTFDSTITDTLKVTTYTDYLGLKATTDVVKIGHKIPTYVAEDYNSPVVYANAIGWNDYVEYVGNYVDASMIASNTEGVEIYATYEDAVVKSAKQLGIKTNLSLYSNFVVNIYVPAYLVDEGYVTVDSTVTYVIGDATYYVVSAGTNYEGVAGNVTFALGVVDEAAYVEETLNVNVSVLKYAEAILANEAYAADHALMNAMLNYVYEAAVYFEKAELAAALVNYNADENEQTYEAVLNNTAANVSTVAVSLNENAPAIVLTLTEAYTGKVTVAYNNVYGTAKTIEIDAAAAEEIVIDELRVYDLDATITVTFEGVEGAVVYNFDAYAAALEGNAAQTVVKALYDYIAAAKAYKLA